MSTVRLIFSAKIHDGKMDEFEEVGTAIMAIVRDKGHRTLEYDWYLNRDKSEGVVIETFADSDALMAHAEMIGELGVRLFSLCDIKTLWLCGDVSQAVLDKTAGFGPTHYGLLQSK